MPVYADYHGDRDLLGRADGIPIRPVTPMMLDILAAQRMYGPATSGPLADGGQIFGFHSNIRARSSATSISP